MEITPEIRTHDFGDGDVALVVELPIPPFAAVPIVTEDCSDDSRSVLDALIQGWEELWPEMLARFQVDIKRLSCGEQELGRDKFMGSISRMDPEGYMGDKSDCFLRLQFDEPPYWDFFLKGTEIVHFQPVF
jgi:hypothetical protein